MQLSWANVFVFTGSTCTDGIEGILSKNAQNVGYFELKAQMEILWSQEKRLPLPLLPRGI